MITMTTRVIALRFFSMLLFRVNQRDWSVTIGVVFLYFISYMAGAYFLPDARLLNPAISVALCILFFRGIALSPLVYIATLAGELMLNTPGLMTIGMPAAITLQSAIGARLLQLFQIDPIFRRDKDILRLLAVLAVTAGILPFLLFAINIFQNQPITWQAWLQTYVPMYFSLLVYTPFIMRWIAKPYFRRTWPEIIETICAFVLLLCINAMLFLGNVETLFGIPFIYFLLLPFFPIALRLRPRFVTLALAITSFFLMYGSHVQDGTPGTFTFQYQVYIIVLAIIFLIMTSLEEHRRAIANQLLSQVVVLQNAVARISSESQAKNDFIAILAHELRNPLTPVVSGIDILKLRASDDDMHKTLDMMTESMKTVRSLLNDLLDVSRISEGKISLDKKRVELGSVLERSIRSTEHYRKQHHQNLFYKDPGNIYVFGDPVRLEQIFSNLLTNASKYSNSGDTITLRIHTRDTFAEIEVLDEGIGIEPRELETIFQPFHQLEGDRSKEGLGIGLSLVKDLVRMHGGSVRAESKGLGHGSRFIVRLPLDLEQSRSG